MGGREIQVANFVASSTKKNREKPLKGVHKVQHKEPMLLLDSMLKKPKISLEYVQPGG